MAYTSGMKRLLVSVAAVLLLSLPARAQQNIALPFEEPTITVSLPDSWTKEKTDSGYSCESDDQEATIVFETAGAGDIDSLVDDNVEWLVKEEKIEIDKSTEKKSEIESGALKFSTIAWVGKNEEWGEAQIMLAFAEIGNGQVLMITYWVTTAGEEKHKKDINAVLDSVKKIGG